MKRSNITARLVFALCLLILGASLATARADESRGLVFFGDSLTDPGNHYIAFGQVTRPPVRRTSRRRSTRTPSAGITSVTARPGQKI